MNKLARIFLSLILLSLITLSSGYYKCYAKNTIHLNACCNKNTKTSCCPTAKKEVKEDSIQGKCCDRVSSDVNIIASLLDSDESILKTTSPETLYLLSDFLKVDNLCSHFIKTTDFSTEHPLSRNSLYLYKLNCAFLC